MSNSQTSALLNIAPVGSTNSIPLADRPVSTIPLPFTDAQVDAFREQDRWLPIANVARIMKASLPSTAKVSKEAKECVQECVSEFISFITSEGVGKCLNEKRKTINGEDILTSLRSLGFDNYEGVMKVYLAKLREHQIVQARQRQHINSDDINDINDELSDEADGNEGKRKRKRTGERNPLKRMKGGVVGSEQDPLE